MIKQIFVQIDSSRQSAYKIIKEKKMQPQRSINYEFFDITKMNLNVVKTIQFKKQIFLTARNKNEDLIQTIPSTFQQQNARVDQQSRPQKNITVDQQSKSQKKYSSQSSIAISDDAQSMIRTK